MAKRKSNDEVTGVSEDNESEVKPEAIEEESASPEPDAEEPQDSAGFLSSLGVSDSGEGSSEGDGGGGDNGTEQVTSLWPGRLIVAKTPSGNRYEWPSSGSTVAVAEEDVPVLREKNRMIQTCCGSSGERRYFDL